MSAEYRVWLSIGTIFVGEKLNVNCRCIAGALLYQRKKKYDLSETVMEHT